MKLAAHVNRFFSGNSGSKNSPSVDDVFTKGGTIPFLSWVNARDCAVWGVILFLSFKLFGSACHYILQSAGPKNPLWPLSGVCVGLVLLKGWRLFPAVFLARLAWEAPIPADTPYNSSWILNYSDSLYAICYSLMAITACIVTSRFTNFSPRIKTLSDVIVLTLVVAPVSALAFALSRGLCMLAGNAHLTPNFLLRIFVAWLGNLEGIIAIAPLFLLVGFGAQFRRPMIPTWKYTGILCLLLLSLVPFTLNFPRANSYPIAFLPYPILIGIALYLGFPFAAFAGALSTLTITYATISGRGPFDAANNRLESFAAVTAFMFVLVETTLLIGIIMQERREEMRRKELVMKEAGVQFWKWDSLLGLRVSETGHSFPKQTLKSSEVPGVLTKDPILTQLEEDFRNGSQISVMKIGDPWSWEFIDNSQSVPRHISVQGQASEVDSEGRVTSVEGILTDITHEKKAAENAVMAARRTTELSNLRSQLNPHFLFNSLNVVKALITEDSTKAQQAVLSLSHMLRYSLRSTKNHLIPLKEEISVIRSFLDLQKMRYEGRLKDKMIIDPKAEGMLIPPMVFQQLVENAVKHGIDTNDVAGEIRVEAFLDHEELVLTTENSGNFLAVDREGLGLSSIDELLNSTYGSKATFCIRNTPSGTVLARIRIPSTRGS